MLLSFAEHTIQLRVWSDKRDLETYLMECDAGNILLGKDAEQNIKFYSIVVNVEQSVGGSASFGIGICSEGHGLTPHLMLLPDSSYLILGFNSEAVCIDVDEKRACYKIKFDSLFRSFIFVKQFYLVLAFHEIGVIAITPQGEEIWRYDKDVITGCKIMGEMLHLNFMDSSPTIINILDGTMRG